MAQAKGFIAEFANEIILIEFIMMERGVHYEVVRQHEQALTWLLCWKKSEELQRCINKDVAWLIANTYVTERIYYPLCWHCKRPNHNAEVCLYEPNDYTENECGDHDYSIGYCGDPDCGKRCLDNSCGCGSSSNDDSSSESSFSSEL